MKVFVLGYSGHGKSPFARKFSEATGFERLRASEWITNLYPEMIEDREKRAAFLTEKSLEELKKNSLVAVEHFFKKVEAGKNYVIDGIRNPLDFVLMFDPNNDQVFWLENGHLGARTTFESEGLDAIDSYLEFLKNTGLMDRKRDRRSMFDCFYEIEKKPNACPNTLSLEDEIPSQIAWFTQTYLNSKSS